MKKKIKINHSLSSLSRDNHFNILFNIISTFYNVLYAVTDSFIKSPATSRFKTKQVWVHTLPPNTG